MKYLNYICFCLLAVAACPADVVNLYFAGGEVNAAPDWAEAIKAELSLYVGNVEVVHANHSGNAISLWYTTSAQANYEADFFNGSGTGALESRIAQIEANGDEVAFKGLFWFQGESDTTDTNTMDEYAGRYNGMLAQLKSDLGMTNDIDFTMALIDLNQDSYYDNPTNADGRARSDIEYMRTVQSNICNSVHGTFEDSRGYDRTNAWIMAVDPGLIDFGTAMAHTFVGNFSLVPVTNTLVLGSHSEDGALINQGVDNNQNIIAGRTSDNQCNGILFFEIPEGKVLNADLDLRVLFDKGDLPAGTHIDVWALGYQSVPQLIGAWNSTSDTDTRLLLNGVPPVKIAEDFVDAGEATPVGSYWSLSEAEGLALADFMNNVKTNGAVAGDYIVLRFNHDNFLDADAGTRWGSSSHAGYEPVLTLEVEQLGMPPQRTEENGYWIAGSHVNDGSISESGEKLTSLPLLSSTGGNSNEPWNGLCFFKLPPQPLVEADLELAVVDVRGWGTQPLNIDLWGLGYQSSPSMNTGWYVSADTDERVLLNGEKPVKIANNIAASNKTYSVGYKWSPNASQKETLRNFINGLYDLGALPGNYAVFRVNMDERISGIMYGLRWGASSDTGSEPLFTGRFTPGENMFLNPGMEEGSGTTVSDWAITANGYNVGRTNVNQRSGDYCLRFAVDATHVGNGAKYAGAIQVFYGDFGGKKMTFSCYARHNADDPLMSASGQKLEIRFYFDDVNNTRLGMPTITALSPTDPVDVYKYAALITTVPEGTVKVTAQFIFRDTDPAITSGGVLVDDTRLEVFEPLPPVMPAGTLILIQ